MALTTEPAKKMADFENTKSLRARLRRKRLAPLLTMIENAAKLHGCVNIIDIGGREQYWNIIPKGFLEANKVSITLVNLPESVLPEDHGPFRFVTASGCDLAMYDDKSFHIAHSNSVIEHVGEWDNMVQFSREMKRIADSYFIQTPNYWFPIEPHCMTPFFQYLPLPAKIWLVMRFSLGFWQRATTVDEAVRTIDRARLLNKTMFAWLFSDAEVTVERFFLLPKSLIAVKK